MDLGFKVESLAVLDLHVYYNRIYVATDAGTWSASLSPLKGGGRALEDQRQLTRLASESLAVGMGAVAVSLGANGLGIYLNAWKNGALEEVRVERESRRSTLDWGRATNYPDDSSYETLEIERVRHGARSYLRGIRPSVGGPVELSENEYALWNRGRLLVANGRNVESRGHASPRSRRTQLASFEASRRPISVSVTGNSMVVTESSSALEVARSDDRLTVYEGPIGSIRTFPGSQRYRRLIAATVEGGFILSAVMLDDSAVVS